MKGKGLVKQHEPLPVGIAEQLRDTNSIDHASTIIKTHIQVIERLPSLSQDTKRTYIRCLNATEETGSINGFLTFIASHGLHYHSLLDYRLYLETLSVSTSTKALHLSVARRMLDKYKVMSKNTIDTITDIESFKASRGHKKDGLTNSEVQRVLEHISTYKNVNKRLRLVAMFHLLAFEGLRQVELTRLKLEHLELESNSIMIQGKGKDDTERFTVMGRTAQSLQAYVDTLNDDCIYLFESTKKKGSSVTRRYIRKLFTCPTYGIFAKCGINKSVHGFRHFNITKTLEVYNGNLAKARRRSRHASFDMLIVYDDERLSKEDVNELEDNFNL